MVNSVLEQYQITDLVEWFQSKRLVLNPDFQRRSIWSSTARVFLIDTILRRLPIPKIYFRQRVDLETRTSYREVVDGQQRLRAIFDFASDQLVLTARAGEFAKHRYSTLDADHQEIFLSYPIAVEQLVNASDDDVLEVFSRLNSYTLPLNEQEKRHARFQGEFKWTVLETARRWSVLWDSYRVVSIRERVRMADDELMAQIFGIVLDGVTNGGQRNITKLYTRLNADFPQKETIIQMVDDILEYIVNKFDGLLQITPISHAPHFLMLFAAVAHGLRGIPAGEIGQDMPQPDDAALSDIGLALNNLSTLAEIVDMPAQDVGELPKNLSDFWIASHQTTQRMQSRKPRFLAYYNALIPNAL